MCVRCASSFVYVDLAFVAFNAESYMCGSVQVESSVNGNGNGVKVVKEEIRWHFFLAFFLFHPLFTSIVDSVIVPGEI